MALAGQGEIHLKVAVEKLMSKYGLKLLHASAAACPTRKPSAKATTQRGRHKRQSGGHGQFGDVVIEIKPMPRGCGLCLRRRDRGRRGAASSGFRRSKKASSNISKRARSAFRWSTSSVTLNDGSYHTVDSSDAAFQTAARIAMQEGMPQCSPVLLEPIMHVQIHVPSDATAKVNAVVSGRRGQLLGFDARAGWKGWDTVEARDAAIGDGTT